MSIGLTRTLVNHRRQAELLQIEFIGLRLRRRSDAAEKSRNTTAVTPAAIHVPRVQAVSPAAGVGSFDLPFAVCGFAALPANHDRGSA